MSACERCWSMAYDSQGNQADRYFENLAKHECTPEQQAGPYAGWCAECGRMSVHQYTRKCMTSGCT